MVETKDRESGLRLIKALEDAGFEVADTSGALAMRS